MRDSDPTFRIVHRAEARRIASIVLAWALTAGVVVAGMVAVNAASGQPAPMAAAIPFAPVAAVAEATPKPAAIAPSSAPAPVATRSTSHTITITATGYQAELDACQWVRMNLLGTVPMVGAHTRCGGAIVLGLRDGDAVRLVGQGLDGTYRVTDSRDAHSGDDAATATAGMDAAIILQTCYTGTGGRVRLVGLVPA